MATACTETAWNRPTGNWLADPAPEVFITPFGRHTARPVGTGYKSRAYGASATTYRHRSVKRPCCWHPACTSASDAPFGIAGNAEHGEMQTISAQDPDEAADPTVSTVRAGGSVAMATSGQITVRIEGLRNYATSCKAHALTRSCAAIPRSGGEPPVHGGARKKAPIDTGRLRNSIGIESLNASTRRIGPEWSTGRLLSSAPGRICHR